MAEGDSICDDFSIIRGTEEEHPEAPPPVVMAPPLERGSMELSHLQISCLSVGDESLENGTLPMSLPVSEEPGSVKRLLKINMTLLKQLKEARALNEALSREVAELRQELSEGKKAAEDSLQPPVCVENCLSAVESLSKACDISKKGVVLLADPNVGSLLCYTTEELQRCKSELETMHSHLRQLVSEKGRELVAVKEAGSVQTQTEAPVSENPGAILENPELQTRVAVPVEAEVVVERHGNISGNSSIVNLSGASGAATPRGTSAEAEPMARPTPDAAVVAMAGGPAGVPEAASGPTEASIAWPLPASTEAPMAPSLAAPAEVSIVVAEAAARQVIDFSPSDSETHSCPICSARFPQHVDMSILESHVNACLEKEEMERIERWAQNASFSEVDWRQEQRHRQQTVSKACPMCDAAFPEKTPQDVFEQHVNTHFGNEAAAASTSVAQPSLSIDVGL